MPDPNLKMRGTQPSPTDRGHPLPQRATPEKSVTLRNLGLVRDAATKPSASGSVPQTMSPGRNSSGESPDTGQSDAKKWFDRSNRYPAAAYDTGTMDIDPPFFQKETDSSNDDMRLDVPLRLTTHHPYGSESLRPTIAHSSSADDYRSVIDDLTIENKRLKEELKRYKQFGPDLLKKEKLFEIKVHGLPRRKKRELEATLRDFAATLEGSSEATSKGKNSKHTNSRDSKSKHASSSSSQSRPVDSAYASMSTGKHSSGTSLGRPYLSSRARSSERKVEHYLGEIPEALYPGFLPEIPDKEKKKLVVKKLEHLFTGKIAGHNIQRQQSIPSMEATAEASAVLATTLEPAREAYIQNEGPRKKNRSRDNLSTSNSHTESGGNGNGSRSATSGNDNGVRNNATPPEEQAPEQRPTRPRDLDPDRVQIPAENMQYLRHLGLDAPDLQDGQKAKRQDVSPDADGWVYLNLLSNLAQLHILNVSPDFIRKAVSEKSTKFQLSSDGRKIRWRGGSEGTKFSDDSSGNNSQRSPSTGEDDGSDNNGQRKRVKMDQIGDGSMLAPTNKNHAKFGPQITGTSGGFHYKPLFIHRTSSFETSLDESGSQDSYHVEESNLGNSRWNYSGSGSSPRKKRRADGAIVFYSGAPFCTDLSGDPGDIRSTTYMTSTGREQESAGTELRPETRRSQSGSSIAFRPLIERLKILPNTMEANTNTTPELGVEHIGEFSDIESDFPWGDDLQTVRHQAIEPTLEPSGVGRVFPEDHFAVVVTTRRPCLVGGQDDAESGILTHHTKSHDVAEDIIRRLATTSTLSNTPRRDTKSADRVTIEYMSGRIRRFDPVPLPPPAMFYPPFSSGSDSESDDDLLDSEDGESRDEDVLATSVEDILSKRANHHCSDTYPDGEDLTSGDEEDEVDDGVGAPEFSSRKRSRPYMARLRASRSASVGLRGKSADLVDSSVATAGGAESGYNSSIEVA